MHSTRSVLERPSMASRRSGGMTPHSGWVFAHLIQNEGEQIDSKSRGLVVGLTVPDDWTLDAAARTQYVIPLGKFHSADHPFLQSPIAHGENWLC